MQVVCVPLIGTLVYSVVALYKALVRQHQVWVALTPVIAGSLGGVLGVCGWWLCPGLVLAANWLEAVLVGVCSGLSATGCHQIVKQFSKLGVTVVAPPTAPETRAKDEDLPQ